MSNTKSQAPKRSNSYITHCSNFRTHIIQRIFIFFPNTPRQQVIHTFTSFLSVINGYLVFPGGKEQLGHEAGPSPPTSAVVMKG